MFEPVLPSPILPNPAVHRVLGTPLAGPFPTGSEVIYFGMGCFWGAERIFWRLPVFTTAVGYIGGHVAHPSYREVCGGETGHAEIVQVVYDPAQLPLGTLLATFWENHDPTQGNRQGNDVGSQYRSSLFWTTDAQGEAALASATGFAPVLAAAGFGPITTELAPAAQRGPFYLAEDYHQQYLEANPDGYCMHGPNGLACPIGIASA